MNSRLWVGWVLVTLGLMVGSAYLIYRFQESPSGLDSHDRPGDPPPRTDRFHRRGVRHVFTHQGRPVLSVDVGEMTHRRRSVGPMAVNPLKEIEMKSVRIRADEISDAGTDEQTAAVIAVQPMLEEILSREGIGLVTRISIEDLVFESLREGRLDFKLTAERALAEAGAEGLQLRGRFMLETGAGHRLEGPSAAWRPDRRTLVIDGPYLLVTPSSREGGSDATFLMGQAGVLERR